MAFDRMRPNASRPTAAKPERARGGNLPGAGCHCSDDQAGIPASCANMKGRFLMPSSARPFMSQSQVFVLSVGRSLRRVLAISLLGASAWSQAEDPKAAKYFEQALGRYDKKDIPGAIIELKNALQIDPTMLPVQMLLGKALMQDGQVAAAEVAFLEALRLGVNRGEIVVPLGQAYLAQGKQKLFMEQPQFALPGLPPGTQLQLLLLRAAAASDLGDSPGALKAMDEARVIDPKSPEVWLAEVPVRIRTRQFKAWVAAGIDRMPLRCEPCRLEAGCGIRPKDWVPNQVGMLCDVERILKRKDRPTGQYPGGFCYIFLCIATVNSQRMQFHYLPCIIFI